MPLIAALVGALITAVGTFIGRALFALGVGLLVFKGIDIAMNSLMQFALAQLNSIPREVLQVVALTKIGSVINMITSALTVRMLISGLQSGTMKKMFIK